MNKDEHEKDEKEKDEKEKKRNSDGGIRTPVSAVKERSDNPYTTSECCGDSATN